MNLALETVLEFNNKDNAGDANFLSTVQQFLDQVKTAIGTKKIDRRFKSEDKHIRFTDFVKTAINILKTYDDDDLEDVFAVFDDEIRKYHYRGCKFYELVEDQNVRRFVANKLDNLKDKPAPNLRRNLDKAIQSIVDSKLRKSHVELLDHVNSLYRDDSSDKLKTFLNNLEAYSSKSKRANLNLIKVVRDGIRSVIFDHYSELNANARKDLKIKLESWRNINHPEIVNNKVSKTAHTKKYLNIAKYSKNNNHANNIKRELTTRTVLKTDKKRDKFSEISDTKQDYTQKSPHYIHKLRHKKQKDVKKEIREVTASKYVTPKKTRDNHKKLYSFITVLAQDMKFKIESTTRKARQNTLLEKESKVMKHKRKKAVKRKPSKNKTNTGIQADKPRLISESDTSINVTKTGILSVEDGTNYKHKLRHHR